MKIGVFFVNLFCTVLAWKYRYLCEHSKAYGESPNLIPEVLSDTTPRNVAEVSRLHN